VRTETKIGDSAVSVSSVAIELARKIFETLEKKAVLLIVQARCVNSLPAIWSREEWKRFG